VPPTAKKIADDVSEILRDSVRIEGNVLYLDCGQLDRKTYQAVNDALDRIGGKWNRKLRGHVFEGDPNDALAEMLGSGKAPARNVLAYFPTPDAVLDEMFDVVRLGPVSSVLEPSAGEGAMALRAMEAFPEASIHCVEIDQRRAETLHTRCREPNLGRVGIAVADFLVWAADVAFGRRFDRVLMNPPFTAPGLPSAYVQHVFAAWRLVAPGGQLIAVVPSAVTFRGDSTVKPLRELAETHGEIVDLPEGAFRESGTDTKCVLLVLEKPSVV
jgi:16S rRNA G966 N2-methylase RsmD